MSTIGRRIFCVRRIALGSLFELCGKTGFAAGSFLAPAYFATACFEPSVRMEVVLGTFQGVEAGLWGLLVWPLVLGGIGSLTALIAWYPLNRWLARGAGLRMDGGVLVRPAPAEGGVRAEPGR